MDKKKSKKSLKKNPNHLWKSKETFYDNSEQFELKWRIKKLKNKKHLLSSINVWINYKRFSIYFFYTFCWFYSIDSSVQLDSVPFRSIYIVSMRAITDFLCLAIFEIEFSFSFYFPNERYNFASSIWETAMQTVRWSDDISGLSSTVVIHYF